MCFWNKKTSDLRDADSIFGPWEPGEPAWVEIEDMSKLTLAHLMHMAGRFPSIKQAKKNGWNAPIPAGYTEFIVGQNKNQVYDLYLESNN